jgi:hypothetical protein
MNSSGCLPRALYRRQQQPDERGDNRDYNEQFHERKSVTMHQKSFKVRLQVFMSSKR